MDAFEQIVAMLLEREGYWVRTSYRVCLTKDEKVRVGIPSSPRWELDVLAYCPRENELLVVECKSYLNSPGVCYESFSGANPKGARRYKLFTDKTLRKVVLSRLRKQLRQEGAIASRAKIVLCLAAGHLRSGHEERIRRHCHRKHWLLFGPEWFGERFADLSKTDYENDIAIIAAKLASIASE